MRKHFIISLILLFSLSLSACTKSKIPTETSTIIPVPVTETIEETSTQITTSEPETTEKSTSQIAVSKGEKMKIFQLLQRLYHKLQKLNQSKNLNQLKIKLLSKMFLNLLS